MIRLSRRAALAAPALLGLAAGARAQTRWQMATPYPDGNFHTRNIREFAAEIEQATGGKLAVTVHSNASLLPMPQIKRGVQTGQVQMGEILLAAYANEDTFFEADSLPFLVPDLDGARKLATLQRPYIETRLARQGVSLLYTVGWPAAGFYTQAPITSLDQFKGSRFRTFSPITNRFAALIGASPVLVQQAELAQAFATGIATAMVTSAQTGVDTSSWDYAKVFTPANFSMTKNAVLISRRALEGLPRPEQEAILAAARKAEDRGWAYAKEAQDATQARLAEKGMTIGSIPADVLAGLRQIGATMAEEWIGRAGEDGRKLVESLRSG
ncbi:TRAP transporter substrate-binding protein [Paracraurococcus ruber]|uniref:TRAP transporter substrate-binding protein DctP n=1 Tax=Paracraurococcus ruber TaxID=77675 RepID=A0ABS1D6P5_9PROT|nr:TRAP transporter substrate-binding protein [Paracraurococcus ruber]MBK1662398.1 TRAP transporter substrate-binding protein DctP [Paracraurococcus ruber]TDG20105.1 TRAP transporter substrate-binding protein DctP [Paracraurococcus ruber]